MRIGMIGLGIMGLRMAQRLRDAGRDLIACDTDAAAAAALGADVAASPADLASEAELVLCSLPSPAVVEAVLAGVAEGSAVRIVVDLSTTGATSTRRVAELLASRNIAFIDAPVSGGPGGAASGALAMMLSGDRAAYERIEPILAVLARARFWLGDTPGLGQTMKLVNNMVSAAGTIAAMEAMVFGAKAGLDSAMMLDVLNVSSGRCFGTEVKIKECILDRSFPQRFSTEMMHKDVRLGLAEAEALGVPMSVIPMVRQFLAFAISQGDGPKDYGEVIKHLERWAGAEFGQTPG
jgi:3-hydroxyisobutyrate dehydrogenase